MYLSKRRQNFFQNLPLKVQFVVRSEPNPFQVSLDPKLKLSLLTGLRNQYPINYISTPICTLN